MSNLWGGISAPKLAAKDLGAYIHNPGNSDSANWGSTAPVVTTKGPDANPESDWGVTNAGSHFDKYGVQVYWDVSKKKWYEIGLNGKHYYDIKGTVYDANHKPATRHASGGAVAAGTQIMVGENGPELFTPTSGGSITPHNLVGGSGMSVHIHVAGSVIHEKDLAVTVRDNIAQLMRRRGLNPAILGV